MTKKILDNYKKKQPFRVQISKLTTKTKWIPYESYNPNYNLREILKDEIVIEFDTEDKEKSLMGINETGINLMNAGISFEVWEHGGKSPHLHIHNLPIGHLEKDKLRLFKKLFIKKYVPKEYLDCVDYSLCGIHLIAIEGVKHWKNKYGVKKLLSKFNSNNERRSKQ